MNYLTSDLPATILFIAIGVIIGAALSKILNKGPNVNELQQKLEDTQDQFDQYQKEVGSHFQETAELVNQLTDSYRQVHEHLSLGAQKLAHKTSGTLTSTQFTALSDDSENETSDFETETGTKTETSEVDTNEKQDSQVNSTTP